jgi:uncharacterized protein (DUF58 family)
MGRALGTAGLGAALTLAAALFATPSLYVPGLALSGLALVSLGWVSAAASGAGLERRGGPARILEGEEHRLELRPRAGPVPPPGGELRAPWLRRPLPTPPLRPRAVVQTMRFERRGRYPLGGASWILRDPLGLCTRSVSAGDKGELLVLPRIEPVHFSAPAAGRRGAGLGSASAGRAVRAHDAAGDFEVDGLRPYREGAPASRIHWPSFARSGELHERRLAAGGGRLPLLVLDAVRPLDPEALDRAVRATASLALHLAERGGCEVLLPGSRGPVQLDERLRTWPTLHGELAQIQPDEPTPLSQRTRGAVIWVSAAAPQHALRRLRALGGGPHHLVAPSPPPGARVVFTVAGCAGIGVAAAAQEAA